MPKPSAPRRATAPAVPFAPAEEPFALTDAACRGHEKREAEIGRRFSQHIGRVADKHATRRARRHIDVVVADRHAAHRFQARASVEQCRIDALAASDEDAGLALKPADELGLRPDVVGLVALDLEMLAQALHDVRKNGAGDKDGRFQDAGLGGWRCR
jgi:hypothetical protein